MSDPLDFLNVPEKRQERRAKRRPTNALARWVAYCGVGSFAFQVPAAIWTCFIGVMLAQWNWRIIAGPNPMPWLRVSWLWGGIYWAIVAGPLLVCAVALCRRQQDE